MNCGNELLINGTLLHPATKNRPTNIICHAVGQSNKSGAMLRKVEAGKERK